VTSVRSIASLGITLTIAATLLTGTMRRA